MRATTLEEHAAFGGRVGYYSHASDACGCDMRFSVFLPRAAVEGARVPTVYWLSGLTCTEDNFTVKAGAYRVAAELGLAVVAPDTSPRGEGVPDDDAYDLGQGAGFYLDATVTPWSQHFNMFSYVTEELLDVVHEGFPVELQNQSVMGHSMGGHGALVIWLKRPGLFRSVSAFSPICAPTEAPWGRKTFLSYLGTDEDAWRAYDASALMRSSGDGSMRPEILIDQGLADAFLDEQLMPSRFKDACAAVGQPLRLRLHEGYDHSYFFISTFVEEHLRHHAKLLRT
ncbi:MAG: S-formylglutathione hydrolase [Nannocystaceae bacterium]|nr:S-formylglutathione hydrolase [Nannocystaceae bacterium]